MFSKCWGTGGWECKAKYFDYMAAALGDSGGLAQKRHHVWACNLYMFSTEVVLMEVNEWTLEKYLNLRSEERSQRRGEHFRMGRVGCVSCYGLGKRL